MEQKWRGAAKPSRIGKYGGVSNVEWYVNREKWCTGIVN
jgi:hypothetical protein